jgi:hypothetical protein
MVDFTADRMSVLPFKGTRRRRPLRSEHRSSETTARPCRSTTGVHATPKGWLAWDVVIEGVSYVKNFRTDFGTEIEQKVSTR